MSQRSPRLAIYHPPVEDIEFSPAMVRMQKALISVDKARKEMALALRERMDAKIALINELGGGLTAREEEILEKIKLKLCNKEIARDLSVSERVVKFHVSSLMRKLSVQSRYEL